MKEAYYKLKRKKNKTGEVQFFGKRKSQNSKSNSKKKRKDLLKNN